MVALNNEIDLANMYAVPFAKNIGYSPVDLDNYLHHRVPLFLFREEDHVGGIEADEGLGAGVVR